MVMNRFTALLALMALVLGGCQSTGCRGAVTAREALPEGTTFWERADVRVAEARDSVVGAGKRARDAWDLAAGSPTVGVVLGPVVAAGALAAAFVGHVNVNLGNGAGVGAAP